MMTAGTHVLGSDVLMVPSARRSVLVKHHEVTQDEWSWLMASSPSFFAGCPDCPVERVSWWDALAYLNRLSVADGFRPCYALRGCTGQPGTGCPDGRPWCESSYSCESVGFAGEQCTGYRLPTSDEWGWVAEATAADPLSVSFPWCADISQGQPRPVSKSPDDTIDGITGNVWEWIWNAEAEGQLRDHAGGSFRTAPDTCVPTARSTAAPQVRSYFVGFRPIRTLPLLRSMSPEAAPMDTAQLGLRGIMTPASAP
jgi:formylglycine-generating enzyme required for sulfatase activity